jgi:hypothetical protein
MGNALVEIISNDEMKSATLDDGICQRCKFPEISGNI